MPDCSASEGFGVTLVSEDFALRLKSLVSSRLENKSQLIQSHVSTLRGGSYCEVLAKNLVPDDSAVEEGELKDFCKATLEDFSKGESSLRFVEMAARDLERFNALSPSDLRKSVSFMLLTIFVFRTGL